MFISSLERCDELNATAEGYGLYDRRRFVLRLSTEMHELLERLPSGINTDGLTGTDLIANSVYLHETWHWWQHIGSSFGFLSSLVYPAQMHANYGNLKEILASFGAVKSIYRVLEQSKGPGGPASRYAIPHVVVNNFADFRTYQALCSHPEKAAVISGSPLYESKGHALSMTYMNIISMLAWSVDRSFETLPDPRPWESRFQELERNRLKHFYRGSPLDIPPVGAHQICEGQCRYNQLLFLNTATNGRFGWNEAEALGMFQPPYDDAFQTFLKVVGMRRPQWIDDPLVGLFLLICDLALNPTDGFPCDIDFGADFVGAADPGIRFLRLSQAASRQQAVVSDAIRGFSPEEYARIGKLLTDECGYSDPLAATRAVCRWIDSSAEVRKLVDQHSSFSFPLENYLVAFLLSHFLAFSRDKHESPEVFCWPGKFTAGARTSEAAAALMEKHGAPFIDTAEGTGIYPRLRSGISEVAISEAFRAFYQSNVLHDLTEQWVLQPGPFQFNLSWLSSTSSHAQLRGFAEAGFFSAYGTNTDSFRIL